MPDPGFLKLSKNISENDLTNPARHDRIMNVKKTRVPMLPTGYGLTAPRLTQPSRQLPLRRTHTGGECPNSLFWQQLDFSRVGVCDGGLGDFVMEVQK